MPPPNEQHAEGSADAVSLTYSFFMDVNGARCFLSPQSGKVKMDANDCLAKKDRKLKFYAKDSRTWIRKFSTLEFQAWQSADR